MDDIISIASIYCILNFRTTVIAPLQTGFLLIYIFTISIFNYFDVARQALHQTVPGNIRPKVSILFVDFWQERWILLIRLLAGLFLDR